MCTTRSGSIPAWDICLQSNLKWLTIRMYNVDVRDGLVVRVHSRVFSPPPARIAPMEGGLGKKEQESYGKVLSSQCFRAHKQLHDFIFVAPGHQDVEFLPAHGSRTQKWQAHRHPARHFCSGSEALPDRHVWSRELGAQPPSGGRSCDTDPEPAQRKDSCHRAFERQRCPRLSGSVALWSPRHSRRDLSRVPC